MTPPVTRQDIQTALERTRSSIMGSMFSRNDAQNVINQLRNAVLQDLHVIHAENQNALRTAQTQSDQLVQRINQLQLQVNRTLEQQAQVLAALQLLLPPNGTGFRRI